MKRIEKRSKKSKQRQKFIECRKFFDKVSKLLSDDYEVVSSCNKDLSAYLVPKGKNDQITYYSKPAASLRVSDHWSWYASLQKCSDEEYIQCHSADLPGPSHRLAPGKASLPVNAPQVCLIYPDGKYHCVFGRFFDSQSNKWKWMEADPRLVVKVTRKLYGKEFNS